MEKKRNNEFESRLRLVLASRKQYAWGESVGATRGSTNRMFKGEIPGWEILIAICDIERTSLNWLLNGVGHPFITNGCRRYETKCVNAFEELFQRHQDWRIHCATQGTHYAIVLTRRSSRMTRDKEVEYTEIQIITDGGAQRLLKRVEQSSDTIFRIPMSDADFERLATGTMGNVELLETINRNASKTFRTIVPSPPAARPPEPQADPVMYNLGRLEQGKHGEVESLIRKMLAQQGDRWEELSK